MLPTSLRIQFLTSSVTCTPLPLTHLHLRSLLLALLPSRYTALLLSFCPGRSEAEEGVLCSVPSNAQIQVARRRRGTNRKKNHSSFTIQSELEQNMWVSHTCAWFCGEAGLAVPFKTHMEIIFIGKYTFMLFCSLIPLANGSRRVSLLSAEEQPCYCAWSWNDWCWRRLTSGALTPGDERAALKISPTHLQCFHYFCKAWHLICLKE